MAMTAVPVDVATKKLPAWSAAVPLWAAHNWLWIDLAQTCVLLWTSDALAAVAVEGGDLVALLSSLRMLSYSLIVLNCAPGTEIPTGWWYALESALEPGGLLFVCGRRDDALGSQVALHSSLRVGAWHVVEQPQGKSDVWRLRPASRRIGVWYDRHLTPAYGLRTLLLQAMTHVLPSKFLARGRQVDCLAFSREVRA